MKVSTLRGMAIGATAALGLALIAPSANAQAQTSGTRFGVEAAFGTNSVGVGAGAFVKFHVTDVSEHPITGRVSFDYFFPGTSNFGYTSSVNYWQIEADGLVDLVAKGDTKPYVGAGLTYDHWGFSYNGINCTVGGINYCPNSSYTGTGLDIVGGLNFMSNAKLMPFVEVKLDISSSYGSGSTMIFRGGIHF
jgi:hypothetical protein